LTDWAPWAGLAVSIVGGALAMAWKLGGLERSVKDLGGRIKRVEDKIDSQDLREARRPR
jgi:hypothetical protein